MKEKIKKIAVLFVVFCALIYFNLTFSSGIFAQAEQNDIQSELQDLIDKQLDELQIEELQKYIDSLKNFPHKSIAEFLTDYMQGTAFDYSKFGEELLQILFNNVNNILPSFACIMAISLLSGILMTLKSNAAGNTSTEIIFFVCYAAVLVPILAILVECFEQTSAAVKSMQTQMQFIFPLMLTLMAASGGAATAAICKPAVGFFSTAIVSIIAQVVLPLSIIIVAFSITGNLTKDLKIGKFTAFFKSINKWIIGICVSVFGIFFTLQGITAASYDGIVRRAAKYAIGSGIPIVGGFLSGGFDLAVAGGILIKNSLGTLGIFLMLSAVFEPLVLLIAVNVLLRFTAAVTQPFGDTRISDFLGETAENLQYCTAGLLLTAFLYFLCIVLMICSSEALL